ncbi:MAG: hypothetical protein MUD11_07435 [Rhodobacteraceae bacterium]|jgi:hypothetical protein|nr:hypothetical protein [Paracoccaceae bacterium]
MTYWTILLITALSGPMDGSQSYVLYPSLADCERATLAVSETLAYDHALDCLPTDTASGSIRPKANPWVQQ